MEPINFYSRLNEPTKLRSNASRCSEAARSLGLEARTLAYTGSARHFLYKNDTPVFECFSWEELLKELLKELSERGAIIPSDRWSSEINKEAM